jgi:hypothetical protein
VTYEIEVDHREDKVYLDTISGDFELTAREAFDLVTELLKAIDGARAYGEWKRGEVPNPDGHKNKNRAH